MKIPHSLLFVVLGGIVGALLTLLYFSRQDITLLEVLIGSGVLSAVISGGVSILAIKYRSNQNIVAHVSQTQFDNEFATYQRLWDILHPVKISALNLRPMMDSVDPKESKEDRIARRLREFYGHLKEYRDHLQKNEPFIDKSVYLTLEEILKAAHTEAIDYEYHERDFREYWDSQRKNHEQINQLIEEACELIRERLSRVKVVSG